MSTAGTTISARVADIAGSQNVLGDPAELAAYEIDGKMPAAGVRPESARRCGNREVRGGRKTRDCPMRRANETGNGIARHSDTIWRLDMSRLDRVVAYDPGDLTLSVEPGIPLRRIASVLGRAPPVSSAGGAVHGARNGGRHDRLGRGFAAAPILRHSARLRARHGIRHRRWRCGEKRRARGEERLGLRPAQADDRRAGHARRHHEDQFPHLSAAGSDADVRRRHSTARAGASSCAMRWRNRRSGRSRWKS